jgi:hypothetical protein
VRENDADGRFRRYCFYYYFARSDMSGFMQTSFFFGYMGMVCYGFFLMLGTVGYRASLVFVRHIYKVCVGPSALLPHLNGSLGGWVHRLSCCRRWRPTDVSLRRRVRNRPSSANRHVWFA